MKTKLLIRMILLVLLMGLLCALPAHAEKSGTCGEGLTWTLNEEDGCLYKLFLVDSAWAPLTEAVAVPGT